MTLYATHVTNTWRGSTYAAATLCCAIATSVQWLLEPLLSQTIFISFFPAIIFASWFGGVGPGLLATALSAFTVALIFMPPRFAIVLDQNATTQLGIFIGIGTLITVLNARLNSRQRILHAERELSTQIEQERQRLETIIATVPGVVWEAWGKPDAAAQRINFVSKYIETLLGYNVEQWLATPNFWLQVVHPGDRERAGAEAAAIFNSKKGGISRFRWLTRDGRAIWVEAHSFVIVDAQGTPLGMRGVTLDISGQILTRAQLEESERRFRTLFEQAPLSIQLLDASGRTLRVNRAWMDLWEIPQSVIENFILKEYNIRQDSQLQKKGIDTYIEKAFAGELTHIPASLYDPAQIGQPGRARWVEAVAYPIKDDQGKVREVVLIHEDVTERVVYEKAITESEERFRLLVEGTKDYAIFMLDPDGFVVSWNSGAERTKGYRANEVVGRHFSVFYTPEDVATSKPQQELQQARDVGEYAAEGWQLRKDGSRFWASTVLTPLHGKAGELRGFSRVIRDITQRKELEDSLREAIRARDEFVSVASHELKTPLTSLKLQAELRQRHLARGNNHSLTPEGLQKMVEDDRRQIDRLARLVDDMLDITRINTGKLTLQRDTCELCDIALDLIERFGPQFEAASCAVSYDAPSPVHGQWDRFRLEQVIINLFTNVIRYAPGRPVHVTIKRQNDNAILSVQDQGPGIAAVDQSKIFGRFARLVSVSERSGLGLGLYIAKEIVEAHGGTITLQSEVGKGTTFTIELPTGKSN